MKSARAVIEIYFNEEKEASIIYRAIKPEILTSPSDKTATKLNLYGKKLSILLSSTDSTAFRAAINTLSRWIKVSKSLMEVDEWSKYHPTYSIS
jgi:KEOPS complex subunit Pcc1